MAANYTQHDDGIWRAEQERIKAYHCEDCDRQWPGEALDGLEVTACDGCVYSEGREYCPRCSVGASRPLGWLAGEVVRCAGLTLKVLSVAYRTNSRVEYKLQDSRGRVLCYTPWHGAGHEDLGGSWTVVQ